VDLTDVRTWLTLLMLAVFAGIVVWAYSSKRKKQFDEAARSVLEDDGASAADKRQQGR
jgi:cytochrome c oxidase cbb3-type subunit IV